MTKNNIEINIYGGNVQVLPNVKEVEQNIYTKDGKKKHNKQIQGMNTHEENRKRLQVS